MDEWDGNMWPVSSRFDRLSGDLYQQEYFQQSERAKQHFRGKPRRVQGKARQGKAQQTVWNGEGEGERLCWFNDAGTLDARKYIYQVLTCLALGTTTGSLVSYGMG